MPLPTVFGEFRLVADPTLRFAPSGVAVANMRVVASKQKKNDQTGEWSDDKVCWLNVVCFKQAAENVCESLVKGDLVEVRGQLETREYEKDGEKRTSLDVIAESVTPSLRFATAKVTKAQRQAGSQPAASAPASAAVGGGGSDPWASPGGDGSEPPF